MNNLKQTHLMKLSKLGYFFYPRLTTNNFRIIELSLDERCRLLRLTEHPDSCYVVWGNENQRLDVLNLVDQNMIPTHRMTDAKELTKEDLIF